MRCPLHHLQKFHSVGRNNALQRGPVRIRSKLSRRTALNAVSRVGQQPGRKQASLGSVPVSLVSHPNPTTAPWGHCLVRSRLCSTERSAEADVPQLGIAVSQYMEYTIVQAKNPPPPPRLQPVISQPASQPVSCLLPLCQTPSSFPFGCCTVFQPQLFDTRRQSGTTPSTYLWKNRGEIGHRGTVSPESTGLICLCYRRTGYWTWQQATPSSSIVVVPPAQQHGHSDNQKHEGLLRNQGQFTDERYLLLLHPV
jgi:hypothetical protein